MDKSVKKSIKLYVLNASLSVPFTATEKIVKHVYCVIKGEKEIKIYDV